MLQQLGEHIAAARQRAARCRQRLLTVSDAALKADLEDMERAWLDLAKHFETLKSMEDFLLDSAKTKGIKLDGDSQSP